VHFREVKASEELRAIRVKAYPWVLRLTAAARALFQSWGRLIRPEVPGPELAVQLFQVRVTTGLLLATLRPNDFRPSAPAAE
jgi:hypothetical protein